MAAPRITPAKRRFLERLKRTGPATTPELARALDMTGVAVRQHLRDLELQGLVCPQRQAARGRGRPSLRWSLTDLAQETFPDRHGELTVGLIRAITESVGPKGLERVIHLRARRQVEGYRRGMPARAASLKKRVAALARQRTAEGYMAEVVDEGKGRYFLIEHHCPICEAATTCTGLCSAELEVFRKTLGQGVAVQRIEHLLSGDERCVYQIQNVRRSACLPRGRS